MKSANKKVVIPIVAILILLVGLITIVSLTSSSSSTMMSLKSEYASFVEKDGIVTEVRFHAPANFNVIQLDSSEVNHDENGKGQQIMTYKGVVKKSLKASEPIIPIDKSKKYQFVFSDKTVTITNGVLADSLQK